MKIRSVKPNNHKKTFEVRLASRALTFPYAKADPPPTADDPPIRVFVDRELAREAFGYVLASGAEGTVHADQVLEYNRDPGYLREALVYRLTIEARTRIATTRLAKREIIRRLGTSATQLYRLLDPKNTRKSIDSMLALLQVLDCEVDLVVRRRGA